MKIKIFFLISAMNALSYLCFGNCCDECWNCWKKSFGKEDENKKEKIEEQIFLEEEKGQEESKNFVNKNWLEKKKPNLKLYKKTELGGDEKIKVTKYKNGEIKIENFSTETNTQKWALFEIKYKKEGGKEGKFVYLYCSDIESVDIKKTIYGIFSWKKNILNISVLTCDTSDVKNMSRMFFLCSNLENLNLSNLDTIGVTDMDGMFSQCSNLKEIKFSDNFNTSNVNDMGRMFYNCSKLEDLDLSTFNTSKVNNMVYMFYNCSSLGNLNLSKFDTKKVIDESLMFFNCNNLNKVIVSKEEDTKNKILDRLKIDVGKWEESEDDDKFILTKNQN